MRLHPLTFHVSRLEFIRVPRLIIIREIAILKRDFPRVLQQREFAVRGRNASQPFDRSNLFLSIPDAIRDTGLSGVNCIARLFAL